MPNYPPEFTREACLAEGAQSGEWFFLAAGWSFTRSKGDFVAMAMV